MNSFFETLGQLGAARLGIMGAIILGLLTFFVFISFRISVPEMKMLYGDLSTADAGAISAKLQESSIPFDVSPDGSKIIVPEDEVGRARMILAGAGLPNGGSMGYEIFDDQSGFGTTNFVQNVNQVRALEGELARTVMSLDGIRSARIHLVLPQRQLFSREKRPSSASVFLGVHGSTQVQREQILSIKSLIASAVPDLKASNVSIIDSNGNLLSKGGEDDINLAGLKAEEMRRNHETHLEEKIEDQVSRIVGFGKVRATVTAEINFDRVSMNEELFDPEGQVLRSSQTTEENSLERLSAGQDVSVENNLPGSDLLLEKTEPSAENLRFEEVTNYEVSKTIRNTVREAGEIERLSIAVLVDGRYSKDEEGSEVYEPRSEEELAQIEKLVRSAAGLNEDRGDLIEIVNMRFAQVDTNEEFVDESQLFGFNKSKLLDFAEILTVMIMVVLVLVLVLQPMVNRLLESISSEGSDSSLEAELLAAPQASPALAAPEESYAQPDMQEESLINIGGVEGKVKASSVKKVEEIVDNYPNESVSVIRSWMTQEG